MEIIFVEDLMGTGRFQVLTQEQEVKDFVTGQDLVIAKFKDNMSEDFGVTIHLKDLAMFIASLPRDAGEIDYVDETSMSPVFSSKGNDNFQVMDISRMSEDELKKLKHMVNDYRYGYAPLKTVNMVPLTAYEKAKEYYTMKL